MAAPGGQGGLGQTGGRDAWGMGWERTGERRGGFGWEPQASDLAGRELSIGGEKEVEYLLSAAVEDVMLRGLLTSWTPGSGGSPPTKHTHTVYLAFFHLLLDILEMRDCWLLPSPFFQLHLLLTVKFKWVLARQTIEINSVLCM